MEVVIYKAKAIDTIVIAKYTASRKSGIITSHDSIKNALGVLPI